MYRSRFVYQPALGLLLLGLCSAGCSDTTAVVNISASDYNQSCSKNSDCMLIDEGSSCCAGCGNAAINVSDAAKYNAAAAQRQATCKAQLCPEIACIFSLAVCSAGKCAACHSPGCDNPDAGTVTD
jgi:hypothetical protein